MLPFKMFDKSDNISYIIGDIKFGVDYYPPMDWDDMATLYSQNAVTINSSINTTIKKFNSPVIHRSVHVNNKEFYLTLNCTFQVYKSYVKLKIYGTKFIKFRF